MALKVQGFRTPGILDFSFSIDLTSLISPWEQIHCKIKDIPVLYPWALHYYTTRGNRSFKNIHIHKQVSWDYDGIANSIAAIAKRITDFNHTIHVSFPTSNTLVVVHGSNYGVILYNDWTFRVISIVTCLWIVLLPIYLANCLDIVIVAIMPIKISAPEFIAERYNEIAEIIELKRVDRDI